jgi:hypothetical protein
VLSSQDKFSLVSLLCGVSQMIAHLLPHIS